MKKQIITLTLAMALALSCLAGCSKSPEKGTLENLKFVEEPTGETKPKVLPQNTSALRIWTTSLQNAEDIEDQLAAVEGKGYSEISLYLLWSDFEVEQDKYAFSFIDEVISKIRDKGYKVSLTLVLWSYNLSWKDALTFHTLSSGELYKYDDIRSESFSVFSQNNRTIAKNAIFALADHCMKTFEEDISQFSVVFSPTGKAELCSLAGIDYSKEAKDGFYTFLEDKYSDISALNSRLSQNFESFEALHEADYTSLVNAAAVDYETYCLQTLSDFIKTTTVTFRSAAPHIPVVLKLSDPTTFFAARNTGTFDLYTLTRQTGIDAVSFVANENAVQTAFLCDAITSTTGMKAMVELDSAVLSAETEKEILSILPGRAILAETANFDGDSPDPTIFTASERENTRPKEIILINTLDYLKNPPADGIYRKLRAAYTSMAMNGEGTATVYTDLQLIENPSLLSGIEEVHLGGLSDKVAIYPALAELLAGYDGRISDNENAQPALIDPYDGEINAEHAAKILEKLKG